MSWPKTWFRRFLLAGAAAGVFVCLDLESAGPQIADAFEFQPTRQSGETVSPKGQSRDAFEFEAKTKQTGSAGDMISLKGQSRDSGWFSIKVDGSVLDLYPTRGEALTSYGLKMLEPVQPVVMEKTAVTDTRITLGVWDDWVRWTSRQAVSNYFKPGTDLGYPRQDGLGFDNGATSQRIETSIWKTDSMRLSLYADYARVGAHFEAPVLAIKRQDPFSKPNSTTTRLGGAVERGPITLTLEQRSQQSLAQDNAPVQVQNQIGVWLNFDQLLGRSSKIREGMSWVVPSSAWLNVGQGRVRASLSQGVSGDTTSDVSAGLSWNVGKIYANLGYWRSDYQSQLYPWKGSAINGSLGFYEGQWGIDVYFDAGRSAYSVAGMQQLTTQTFDVTSGLRFHGTIGP